MRVKAETAPVLSTQRTNTDKDNVWNLSECKFTITDETKTQIVDRVASTRSDTAQNSSLIELNFRPPDSPRTTLPPMASGPLRRVSRHVPVHPRPRGDGA